ncbi:MAG: hypothetical protein J4215_05635 [Candidatus Diapherotrites archaeon]|uniref:Uncharacterized protein n=1 Tax=Candidatus Iainarchaeum sp. TaxID=3101447 RepID=A0A8T4LGK5_9ARCH|nr:hypothetical protein [Candidatus Diapherotrites archaeon]
MNGLKTLIGLLILLILMGCCSELQSTGLWGKTGTGVNGRVYYSNCYDSTNAEMQQAFIDQGKMPPTNSGAINVACTPVLFPEVFKGVLMWGHIDDASAECVSGQVCAYTDASPGGVFDMATGSTQFAYCQTLLPPACSFSCTEQFTHACGTAYNEMVCPPECGTCTCTGLQCLGPGEICMGAAVCTDGSTVIPQVRKYTFATGTDASTILASTGQGPDFFVSNPSAKPVSSGFLELPLGALDFVRVSRSSVQMDGAAIRWVLKPDGSFQVLAPAVFTTEQVPVGDGNYYSKIRMDVSGGSAQDFLMRFSNGEDNFCTSPSGLPGVTGPAAFPRVKFDWSWTTINESTCLANQPDGIYCDSTQFSISLLRRLEKIDAAIRGNQPYADLLSFDAQLMKDGISQDFRKDFDFYMKNVGTFKLSVPTDYAQKFSLLVDSTRLSFSFSSVPKDPLLFDKPGVYRIVIGLSGDPSNPHPPLDPTISGNAVRVNVEPASDPLEPNAFYYLPLDADLGMQKRPDEAASSRDGYGTVFSGESLLILPEILINPLSSVSEAVVVSTTTDFSKTQVLERGKLFSFNRSAKTLSWSKVDATPVLAELAGNAQSMAEFFYSIRENNEPLNRSGLQSSWKIAADSRLPPDHCAGSVFADRPPLRPSCAVRTPEAMGVLQSLSANNQMLLETVFFTPSGKKYLISSVCGRFLSPDELANGGESLSLAFSANHNWSAGSLSDLVNQVKERRVCVVSPGADQIELFWNEKTLLKTLSDKSIANTVRDYRSIVTDPDWWCPED